MTNLSMWPEKKAYLKIHIRHIVLLIYLQVQVVLLLDLRKCWGMYLRPSGLMILIYMQPELIMLILVNIAQLMTSSRLWKNGLIKFRRRMW